MPRMRGLSKVVFVLTLLSLLSTPSILQAQNSRFDEFTETKPLVGETAPDFTLETLDGEEFTLSETYVNRPVVIEFGSYTWPPFRRRSVDVEQVRNEFDSLVTFIILYQREAHAGQMQWEDVEQPETMQERRVLARKACDELQIATTVVIDDMENSVRTMYGHLPNSAYIIANGGEIVHKEVWAQPADWPDILRGLIEHQR
jgi:alkyl hydroperoxide reductase subunit AhpC